jgi:nucleotide-binding universal stress UspA family protein
MNTASPPVVVGVDGSADANRAIEYAAWEAGRRHRPLRLVHGFVPVPMFGPTPLVPYNIETPLRATRAMINDMARAASLRHPELALTTSVIAGSPAGVLVEESANACLMVVGSRGRGGFAGLLAGSVSAQVATHAQAPVVVLRPPSPGEQPAAGGRHAAGEEPGAGGQPVPGGPPSAPGEGPVVVGVDGSSGADAALAFAFDEAAGRGTELVAVYAWGVAPTGTLGPVTARHYEVREAQDEADRLLAEAVAGWRERYPDVKVDRRAIHTFNPVLTLMEEAAAASLIVVGPRGRGGFASLMLGSVADGLLRHADRPVAIAR